MLCTNWKYIIPPGTKVDVICNINHLLVKLGSLTWNEKYGLRVTPQYRHAVHNMLWTGNTSPSVPYIVLGRVLTVTVELNWWWIMQHDRLRVIENNILKMIRCPRRRKKQETGESYIILHYLSSSPDTVWAIKQGMMWRTGHMAHIINCIQCLKGKVWRYGTAWKI